MDNTVQDALTQLNTPNTALANSIFRTLNLSSIHHSTPHWMLKTSAPLNIRQLSHFENIMLTSVLRRSHTGFGLHSVSMDPSSHSVYLAGASWHAYTEPSLAGNDNGCHGDHLGALGGGCQNLDNTFPGNRIACVQVQ